MHLICANVGFGRLAEQFRRGHRGGDYTKLSISPKAYTTMKRCMIIDVNDDFIALASSSADAPHPKTHNLNQTKQYTPRLMIIFTPCPPNLAK
jgi:hypothetical protein